MLTWSFGCTGFLLPSSPPSISIARLEMTCVFDQRQSPSAATADATLAHVIGLPERTSLAFMFVCVPEPV